MQRLEHKPLTNPNEVARSSAEAEEQSNEASSSYSTAAASEKLAGKIEMEGVKSFDGKLERNDLASDDQVEEVMKKSSSKREYLKKRPSQSTKINNTQSNVENQTASQQP